MRQTLLKPQHSDKNLLNKKKEKKKKCGTCDCLLRKALRLEIPLYSVPLIVKAGWIVCLQTISCIWVSMMHITLLLSY